MAIVTVFEFPTDSIEKYEKIHEVGGEAILAQPKRLYHLCYRTGEVGFVVVDIWEDEESFAAFGDIIGPAAEKVGLVPKPLVYPLVGRTDQAGNRMA